jgi:uncharacterized protein (DUF1684 family)
MWKWFLVFFLCSCLFLIVEKAGRSFADGDNNPMDRREEKLRIFREKRDQFFKEDPHSPLKESGRKRFKGLCYYPVDLHYAMIGSIERYPTEPKPLYANLSTNKGKEVCEIWPLQI